MKSKKIKQLLAVTLTATMLAQPVSAQIVFAEDAVNVEQQEQQEQTEKQEQTEQQEQAEQQEQTEKQEQAVSPAAYLSQTPDILPQSAPYEVCA